jgi:hypothetical protein
MQHGDIRVRISLYGEPQKITTYWRASLRDTLPETASVTILKMRRKPSSRQWWYDDDPNFYFERMTRTEKKRAELSISDKSLYMTAAEIETARHLTETTYDWLSGRRSVPTINQPNRKLIDRIGAVFRKALNIRKAKMNKRITEVFGHGVGLTIEDRPVTDDMIEGYQYEEIMAWLDAEANKKPKNNIRVWRCATRPERFATLSSA